MECLCFRRKVKSGDKRKQAPEPRKLKKQRSGTVWHNNARSEDDDNYTDNFNRSDVNDEVDQFFDERDKVIINYITCCDIMTYLKF